MVLGTVRILELDSASMRQYLTAGSTIMVIIYMKVGDGGGRFWSCVVVLLAPISNQRSNLYALNSHGVLLLVELRIPFTYCPDPCL